jgi:alpha-L-rhamnosidase
MVWRAGDDLIWDNGFQFGDWLDPAAPPNEPANARADRYFICTAYFAHSTQLLSQAAAVLDKGEDAERYAELAASIREAFRERYAPDGLRGCTAQTELVLALAFDLLLEGQRAGAAARLASLVAEEGGHLGTGFLGTPDLCDVLTDHGFVDVAYELLLQRTCPSWLYPVTKGATTIWERWDAIEPDDSINPGEMLSFNHYAFGAIGAWLYGTIAGIRLDEDQPGWRRFRIQPRPGGGLTHARARIFTRYGPIESAWELDHGRFSLSVEIPPNTTAVVSLPGDGGEPIGVGSGRYSWEIAAPSG